MRDRDKAKFKKDSKKKKDRFLPARKKICRFCAEKIKTVDYKDVKRLEQFIKERGKLVSGRISGNCAKHQRRLVEAVKRARHISLLPYTRV
jgi:small subunit ribosomal protein S18